MLTATLKPPGLKIFFSYPSFFFYVRVSRALITITSQRNQFPRQGTLGQSASGHLSIGSASFPVIFLRKRRARWQFAASKLKPERGMVSLEEFEARWTKKAEKFLAAKSLEICESNQSAAYVLLHRNPETNVSPRIDVCFSALCLFLDSVSNYIDVCVFRAIF